MTDSTRRTFLKQLGGAAAAAASARLAAPAPSGRPRMPRPGSHNAGDWPVNRGDTRLTGRASLPGELREAPAVAWRYKIEGGEVWAVIDPAAGKREPARVTE